MIEQPGVKCPKCMSDMIYILLREKGWFHRRQVWGWKCKNSLCGHEVEHFEAVKKASEDVFWDWFPVILIISFVVCGAMYLVIYPMWWIQGKADWAAGTAVGVMFVFITVGYWIRLLQDYLKDKVKK